MWGAIATIGGGLIKKAGSSLVKKAGGLLSKGLKSAAGRQVAKSLPTAGNVLTGIGIGAGAAPVLRNLPPLIGGGSLPALPNLPDFPSFGGGGGRSGGSGKRYRRMNAGNAKALRRAARRLEAGEKLFRKIYSIRHGATPRASCVTPKRARKRA